MILNSGLNFGVKKSIPHYLGISLGFPMMVLIVALGLEAVFLKYLWLKSTFKWIGAAYMLYLSWRIASSAVSEKTRAKNKPLTFFQGFLFQWVNPKAWLMAIGAISIFSISADYFHNALAISGLFLLMSIPITALWLIGGAMLKKLLREEKHMRGFNMSMAICLAASVILIFLE